MEHNNAPAGLVFNSESLLLWFAVGLAVVFLGVLAFDVIKRRRRSRQDRWREPRGMRATLLKPVHRVKALQSDLEQMLHERARRNDPRPPSAPPETPP